MKLLSIDRKNRNIDIKNAAKWSMLTQIGIKLIAPITNMILARLLVPEIFGIVTTINMIITFLDMITEAGFQKYIIQHEFKNYDEKDKVLNVAFWSNLTISILMWIFIFTFRDFISELIGIKGLGNALVIACLQIPITSFISIQIGIYRREFMYKELFFINIILAILPIFITIPLAILGFEYWSLIIGNLCGNIINAVILHFRSRWKPSKFYEFKILKDMISFTSWSLFESILVWMTTWIDIIIIGNSINNYYLGIYKISLSTVNAIMMIITSALLPILFSALSREQSNEVKFNNIFYNFQKLLSILIIPMGVGIYFYRELITNIMLGDKWNEASIIIGLWGITSALRIVFTSVYSEVYRAKGKPEVSSLAQIIHLVILIPTCIISLKKGFWNLIFWRSFIRLEGILSGFILMKFIMKMNIKHIIVNSIKPIVFTAIMIIQIKILKSIYSGPIWDIISIIVCIISYLELINIFDNKTFKLIINTIKIRG